MDVSGLWEEVGGPGEENLHRSVENAATKRPPAGLSWRGTTVLVTVHTSEGPARLYAMCLYSDF